MTINNILLEKTFKGYQLTKPLTITVTKTVISKLSSIYVNNQERGGLLALNPVTKNIALINSMIVLENISGSNTGFVPNQTVFDKAVKEILSNGCLPMVFHTHPTVLGYNIYDNRKQNFYLRASAPDRKISKQEIVDGTDLFMPECIFVKDKRFKEGYALAMYGGGILPNGFSRLSALEFIAVGASLLSVYFKKFITPVLLGSTAVIISEETNRPKYKLDSLGNYIISI